MFSKHRKMVRIREREKLEFILLVRLSKDPGYSSHGCYKLLLPTFHFYLSLVPKIDFTFTCPFSKSRDGRNIR